MRPLLLLYLKQLAFIVTQLFFFNAAIHSQIITTIAGNGTGVYNGDSILATQAQFLPTMITTDRAGNIFIADLDDSRIRKIDRDGIISTVSGNGVRGFSGDGGPAVNATINYPWGITLDSSGNLFICDDGESRIRKVTVNGIINTIAGIDIVNGGGYNGDNILAINARFLHPSCIALDTIGNLYICDQGGRIRKINTAGIITTIAGTGVNGYTGDGGLAINATIGDPIGIVAGKKGNIYFTDIDNHVVRKIDKDGIITTIAGTGVAGYTGDGGPANLATLDFPGGLAVSGDGTLFIADTYNHAVRKIDIAGIITTVIGDGSSGFSGDGGLAKNAKLSFPAALTFDNEGNLLIADYGNARIRKVSQAPLPVLLTAFDAIYYNSGIKLSWQTATEINTAYFDVQRSKDGNSFTTIGKVAATGNSGISNNYHFIDEKTTGLEVNILYYRLGSTDKNGNINYSKTVSIKLKYTRPLVLYPNPVKNVLNAKLNSSKKEMVIIQVTDLQGKVVKQISLQLYIGANDISIDVTALAKGSYVIKIKGASIQYKQFIKS